MCGFVGILEAPGTAVDAHVLSAMTDAQSHRGPDDKGTGFFDLAGEGAALSSQACRGAVGFRRLSIQDLSPAGHQPMQTESERLAIVFNGEIYNAPELRAQLAAEGVSFRGHSDTEVLLRLYERLGEGFLEPLNGMFAIAVIDRPRGRLLLARDRIGIKPLYYTRIGETVLFGSEIKSFLSHPRFRARLDPARLDEFVQFRYCTGGGTLLEGVHQLPPGHVMVIGDGGQLSPRPYWSLPAGTTEGLPLGEAAELLEDALETSVRRQLLADVEVGCQLSGGIDSSLVNLFAARNVTAGMQSFSVTLGDPRFSEAPWIREAATKAGVHSNCYQLDAAEFVEELDRASWHFDQPLNHPNSLGLLFLSRHASRHVKVLLSGEGADEVLGGYPRFFHARLRALLRPALPALAHVPRLGSAARRRLGAGTDDARFWIAASGRVSPATASKLLGRPVGEGALAERLELFARTPGVDFLTTCMNYETSTYLVDLLMRQDRMTMAHSIENRVPFLDHTLIETIRGSMGSRTLVGGVAMPALGDVRRTKRPLKVLSEKYFGAAFTYRAKSGFALPLQEFFSFPRMAERMEDDILPGIDGRGVFNAAPVRAAWRNIGRASAPQLDVLWSMVAFELWAKAFLDGRR